MLHVFLLPIAIMGLIGLHFYTLRIPHVNNQTSEEIDFDAEAEKYLSGKKKSQKLFLSGLYSSQRFSSTWNILNILFLLSILPL